MKTPAAGERNRGGRASKALVVALLLLGAIVLGATVLREPIAYAAQTVDATIIGPLDGGGNVKVHEQGIASVAVVGDVSASWRFRRHSSASKPSRWTTSSARTRLGRTSRSRASRSRMTTTLVSALG